MPKNVCTRLNYFIYKKIFLVTICFFSSNIYAWSKVGHKTVALIAQENLSKDAKNAIAEILSGASLVDISTWADDIKQLQSKRYKSFTSWHYLVAVDGEIIPAKHGNLITGLKYSKDILTHRHDYNKKMQYEALALLVHFIADLHQPLHIGNGLDRGGNNCYVFWFGKRVSLHALWDYYLISSLRLDYTQLASLLSKESINKNINPKRDDILDWVYTTASLRDEAYPMSLDGRYHSYCSKQANLFPVISKQYIDLAVEKIKLQLYLAGIRLAGILNDIFVV